MAMSIILLLCFIGLSVADEPRIIQGGKEIRRELESPIVQPAKEILRDLEKSTRIVRGNEVTEIGKYPYQVSLQTYHWYYGYRHFCGGSLIAPDIVLTAAHCVEGASPNQIHVYAGILKLSQNDGIEKQVTQIVMHPQYNGNAPGYPNDIALLYLTSSFTMTNTINTITLASASEDFKDADCWITGWGATAGGGGVTNELREAKIGNIGLTECSNRWSDINGAEVSQKHICLYDHDTKVSACSGDSGGPYVCFKNKVPILAGVTSWGISSCDGSYPSVYTRVSSYVNWI